MYATICCMLIFNVEVIADVETEAAFARLHHFAAVLGLMSSSRLNCLSQACDRFIAALTAYVVVAAS